MIDLKDKVILVTGASKGIGYYLVEKALDLDAKVIATSRNISNFDNLNISKNTNFYPFELNLLDTSNIISFLDQVDSNNLHIDILINNAGIAYFQKLEDTSIENISNTIDVNFKNTITLTKLLLSGMIERKSGVIANILSGAIERNFAYSSVYSGTKAAIRALSRSLREEVRDKNIKIIDILPGATSTEIWDKNMLDKFSDRMIHPKDLAEVILTNIALSYLPNIMIEDIIIKPQLGDL